MAKKEEVRGKVIALTAIEHDGEQYGEGDEIEVTESQAEALIAGGAAKVKPARTPQQDDKKPGDDKK